MGKVEELQKQLELAKAAEANEKIEDWKKVIQGLIGKCYKVSSGAGYAGKINSNHIRYMKILGYHPITVAGQCDVKVKSYNIAISPVGWSRKEGGVLAYRNVQNNFTTYRKKDLTSTEEIKSGKFYEGERLTIVQTQKDGVVCTGYSGTISNWWKPVDEREMLEVEAKCGKLSAQFYKEMVQYVDTMNYSLATEESEQMMPQIDEAALKRLDALIASTVDIKLLVNTVAGKVTKYNFFDAQNRLGELAQYSQSPDKGLSISIEGGNGGTDYEPYTTHYYITGVEIDWAYILYPIRLKLNCKVFDLVDKLNQLSEVKDISNWECNYDTATYDATFHSAKLKTNTLEVVNALINSCID